MYKHLFFQLLSVDNTIATADEQKIIKMINAHLRRFASRFDRGFSSSQGANRYNQVSAVVMCISAQTHEILNLNTMG